MSRGSAPATLSIKGSKEMNLKCRRNLPRFFDAAKNGAVLDTSTYYRWSKSRTDANASPAAEEGQSRIGLRHLSDRNPTAAPVAALWPRVSIAGFASRATKSATGREPPFDLVDGTFATTHKLPENVGPVSASWRLLLSYLNIPA
jgi:hypothetical protein